MECSCAPTVMADPRLVHEGSWVARQAENRGGAAAATHFWRALLNQNKEGLSSQTSFITVANHTRTHGASLVAHCCSPSTTITHCPYPWLCCLLLWLSAPSSFPSLHQMRKGWDSWYQRWGQQQWGMAGGGQNNMLQCTSWHIQFVCLLHSRHPWAQRGLTEMDPTSRAWLKGQGRFHGGCCCESWTWPASWCHFAAWPTVCQTAACCSHQLPTFVLSWVPSGFLSYHTGQEKDTGDKTHLFIPWDHSTVSRIYCLLYFKNFYTCFIWYIEMF